MNAAVLLLVFSSLALAASSSTAASEVDERDWVQLEAERMPPEWEEFLERITSRRWVVSEFVEKRFFSFRSQPVELAGTVWFGREEGLTLAYHTPRREIVRVDEKGVRLILDDGRSRNRRIPERGREVPAALLALFRFDFPEIEKTFEIEGFRDGEGWSLRLVPRKKEKAPIQQVMLAGSGENIGRIVIEQPGARRIELVLTNPAYPDLGPEERAVLFP